MLKERLSAAATDAKRHVGSKGTLCVCLDKQSGYLSIGHIDDGKGVRTTKQPKAESCAFIM